MEEFFVDLSIVFVVSALLATVAVLFKQPIILAYIACGVLVGPWGIGWIHNVHFMEVISHLGITLLKFVNSSVGKLLRLSCVFVVGLGFATDFIHGG